MASGSWVSLRLTVSGSGAIALNDGGAVPALGEPPRKKSSSDCSEIRSANACESTRTTSSSIVAVTVPERAGKSDFRVARVSFATGCTSISRSPSSPVQRESEPASFPSNALPASHQNVGEHQVRRGHR